MRNKEKMLHCILSKSSPTIIIILLVFLKVTPPRPRKYFRGLGLPRCCIENNGQNFNKLKDEMTLGHPKQMPQIFKYFTPSRFSFSFNASYFLLKYKGANTFVFRLHNT